MELSKRSSKHSREGDTPKIGELDIVSSRNGEMKVEDDEDGISDFENQLNQIVGQGTNPWNARESKEL